MNKNVYLPFRIITVRLTLFLYFTRQTSCLPRERKRWAKLSANNSQTEFSNLVSRKSILTFHSKFSSQHTDWTTHAIQLYFHLRSAQTLDPPLASPNLNNTFF